MIDYVNGMGDQWIRLVEQMIPATTIWNGGTKFENSIFHRQKFVYRLQRGCQIIPVPCEPCIIFGNLFPYDCIDETISCPIYPWLTGNSTATSFNDVLYQTLLSYLNSQSINISNCLTNTLVTDWYIDLKLDGVTLIQEKIYTGYGLLDSPTNVYWKSSLETYLDELINDGFNYYFNGNTLYVSNSGCEATNQNKLFQLNVGLDFSISCS